MQLVRQYALSVRWVLAALAALLLLSSGVTVAHSTATVEHDFHHIVHNVDNRSPEIDPFWYVGRGVRPIGRFGKRHSGSVSLGGSRGEDPPGLGSLGLGSLGLLLDVLRNNNKPAGRDWRP
ncbi:hypothetical protein NHX12_021363 [Muraenolepis orangiensis]|uniref:Prolactin-releasing peptide n=1 Tax=Muraenolepis orangiensis TaxID=630683 RepID=A0A9Q0EPX7_9TELE|nr:hypothetical protein NHX12_021363 [Muraenolepis orangiensis]